jgi:ubiquitin-activating enzyme E1
MDENLYSRQIAAIGAETQKKLIKKRVFLQGLRGLGVEIAKNIIMAGPGKVDLCDPETVRPRDLGSNFYLTEASVGKPRAACCLE